MSKLDFNIRALFITVILSVAMVTSCTAQNKRPKKKKNKQESAIVKEQSNKAEKQAQYRESRDKHDGIQDKKTLKRMKQTRKKSMIHAGKKKLPFYKRWFKRN